MARTGSYGYATHSSRRGISTKLAPVAKSSYSYASAAGATRTRLRGVDLLKYGNTYLTQERMSQKFGIDINTNPDYEETADLSDFQEREIVLREEDFVNDEEGVQLEFNLLTTDQLERHLVDMIRKYRIAFDRMGAAALLWDDLMEDLEDDDHLDQEFKKFQMLRKLKGGQL